MGLKTLGFVSLAQRMNHFQLHGSDFGCANEIEYELLADEFLGVPRSATVLECTRRSGDMLRFDATDESFGALTANRAIKTFYKPVPCWTLPAQARVGAHRNCHQYSTNQDYFQTTCRQ